MVHPLRLTLVAASLVFLSLAAPTRGADVEKLLPDDAETVVAIHVHQILESPVGKKYAESKLREAMKSQGQAEEILKDLGFDPFRDLDHILLASPGGANQDRALVIANGKFDVARFEAKADDVVKNQGDVLKLSNVGSHKVYEVNPPDGKAVFVCIVNKDLVLVSPAKVYVTDALAKLDGKKAAVLKSALLKDLLTQVNTKQSVWVVATKNAFPKDLPLDNPKVKEGLDNIEAAFGGITVGEDVKVELVVVSKDAPSAKQLSNNLSEMFAQTAKLLEAFGGGDPKMKALVELLGTIRVSDARDKQVTIKATVSNELVGKLAKALGQ